MDRLHQYPEDELRTLAIVFALKLIEKTDEYEQQSQAWDVDVYRQELAKHDPRIAKTFEKATLEELLAASPNAAIADAVAYTIRFALDHFDVRMWGDDVDSSPVT